MGNSILQACSLQIKRRQILSMRKTELDVEQVFAKVTSLNRCYKISSHIRKRNSEKTKIEAQTTGNEYLS
jgi:hypothetical protein